MKTITKILFLCLLSVPLFGQDMSIDKGSGIVYFSDEPGTTPDVNYGSEFAINTTTREVWIWNRSALAWQRQINITQGSTAPSGDPLTAPYAYLNTTTGRLYFWDGDSWELQGGSSANFTGATPTTAGTAGLVPAPSAGQDTMFLRGDGTWVAVTGSGGGATMTGAQIRDALEALGGVNRLDASAIQNLPTGQRDTSYTITATARNAVVFANGGGVTWTRNAATGEYSFAIPDGVTLHKVVIDADNADDDGNGELFVRFVYSGTRIFNQSLVTAWRPNARIFESGGSAPSRSSPKNVLNIPVQGISDVGSGELEITLTNMNTITPNPVIEITF